MQMPMVANDVFMGRFIALPGVAVKQHRPQKSGWLSCSRRLQHFVKQVGTVMKHSPATSAGVTIRSESDGQTHTRKLPGNSSMARSKHEPNRAKPALANHYRAIGPAAIVAALLHTAKKNKPAQRIVSPRPA
jgi:hypothetical protein